MQNKSLLRAQRNTELNEAGYGLLEVNSTTYESVENALNTDLSEISLNPDGHYLIVFQQPSVSSGINIQSTSPAPYYFTHTYQNVQYSMRKLFVYDDSSYAGADYHVSTHVDLNYNLSDILDTVVSVASYLPYVGNVINASWDMAQILGLTSTINGPANGDDLVYFANTEWQRTFIQVYNPSNIAWSFGSCVERKIMKNHFGGYIWVNGSNVQADTTDRTTIVNSSHYTDDQWQRDTAAYVFISPLLCEYDIAGDAKYIHNGQVKITHPEPQ
jgi:hypothetical protein